MMKKLTLTALLILVASIIAGTQYFAHQMRMSAINNAINSNIADARTGIVVATGLDGRVAAGINILVDSDVGRLLISGAGKGVRKSDIMRIVTEASALPQAQLRARMACCVDLGFDAADTKGNAAEAKAWADTHGLDHIIIVTSDFHMPRALIAFRQHFTEDQLTPYHVKTAWLQLDEHGFSGWWHTPERIQLMAVEMVKYLARAMLFKA